MDYFHLLDNCRLSTFAGTYRQLDICREPGSPYWIPTQEQNLAFPSSPLRVIFNSLVDKGAFPTLFILRRHACTHADGIQNGGRYYTIGKLEARTILPFVRGTE